MGQCIVGIAVGDIVGGEVWCVYPHSVLVLMSTHVMKNNRALAMLAHVAVGFSLLRLFPSPFSLGSVAVVLFLCSWLDVVVDLGCGGPSAPLSVLCCVDLGC